MWHILINGEKKRRCGNCNCKPLICAYLQMNLILKGIGIEKNAYLCTVVSEPPKPLSRATGKRVGTSGRGVCRQRQTYKKDVVTAFYLRHLELRNFGTYHRNNAMCTVHGLAYGSIAVRL